MGFLRLVLIVLVGVAGWIIGSVYPAPAALVERVNPAALEQRAIARLQTMDWGALSKLVPEAELRRLSDGALSAASAAGHAIMVERDELMTDGGDAPETLVSAPATVAPTTPGAAPVAPVAPTQVASLQGVGKPVASTQVAANQAFDTALSLCPRMTVSNAPRADATGRVTNFSPVLNVQGVAIARFPTTGACLSSAFGPRGSKQHKGVDYHAANGGPIFAAADGVVLEIKYRDDFGNMLLIDHGNGVYTRYAHLASFQRGLAQGSTVRAGDSIGLMGNTASYPVPIHLHYEVLTGDYANPKASFGLTPVNPFS